MATIIKNTASNVSPTELSIARRTGAGSDTIYVVQGGLGGTIDGGGGIDHLVLDQTGAYTFNFNPGSSFASLIGIEIVSLGTKGTAGPLTTGSTAHSINASAYTNGLTINGNNGANSITGTAFNDIISGGGGTDTLNGGEGSDTYLYTTLADFDAEKGAGLNDTGTAGTDTVSISATSGTFTLAAFANGIEAYTITGTTGTAGINASAALSGLVLTGGGGANAITGSNFADTISGGGGADNLIGGGGDDTFVYALSTDFAAGEKIDGGAGTSDTILISAPSGLITLSNVVIGVEFVTLTGSGTAGVNAAAVLNGLIITGNGGADTITGTNAIAGDTISGGLGNDTITGGGGTDVLDGGEGSDTYIYSQTTDFVDTLTDTGASGTDTVSITATTGTLTLTAALNGIEAYTIAGAGAVSIVASAVTTGLTLTGSTGINTLTGTAQADVITGGAGKDILNGGGGDDTFDYALIADYASESIDGGLGTDTIRFSGTTGTLVLGNTLTGVEQVLLAGSGAIGVDAKAVTTNGLAITGNAGNNTITGTNNADSIDGGGGNDTITGGTGDDILLGGLGNDTFIVALGTDHGAGETINGQEGTDAIGFVGGSATASVADRTLTLTAGDDVENIFMAAATGAAAPTGTVALNVDASAMTTTGHGVNITGNNGANALTGSAFGDTLSGGAGNDSLSGGDGDDAFLYATQAEYTGDTLNGGTGTDTLRYTATAAGTFTLANNLTGVEAVALSNAAGSLAGTVALGVDASLVTSALAIYGNAGANAIRGGTAADTLDGGAGNDIFLIKDAAHHGSGEVIVGGAGTADEIRFDSATIDSTLVLRSGVDASVERAVIGTGTAAAAVTTATTALNIDASAVANAITLVGNNGANILIGGAGNDTLDGGAGNDLLDGGEGSDTYLYGATANYGIEESISDFGTSGTDTIQISAASGSLVLRDDTTGIEQVVITGAAAGVDASAVLNTLTITGGSGANAIKGTAFADTITGGAGADNMSGNGGNDVFILNTAAEGTGDVITGGDGYDTVRFLGTGATATTNTLTIAATTNVEEIEISDVAGLNTGTAALNINAAAVTASGIRFTGNAGANTITGGSGADIIEGGAGNDILNGGGGNDAILVGNGSDHITGEKIDGGAGTADTVRFTSTTATDTLNLLANTVGIERVEISDAAGDTSGTTALNVNASAVTVALTITGNDGANTITGTNAADTINAGGGDDIIIVSTAASHGAAEAINGGAGSDTLRYASTTAGETLTTTGLTGMENIVIGTAGGVTTGTTALNVDASNSGSALAITGNDGVNTLTGSSFSDTLNGNAGADVLNGGGGNDTLDGGADSDIMNGAEGDDSFRDVNMGDQIYGGAGNDALSASTAMPDFNLTDLDIGGATTVNLVERIDLTAAGANVLLTFVAADIEAIVGAGGTLVIDADGGDELFSTEDWGAGTPDGDYTRYSLGGVDILVTSAVGFGKTFTGTTGADNFIGSNSPDTFLFTHLTLNNNDTLDGGVNTSPADRIIITGGDLVDFLASTATINGIEVIQIGDNLDTQLVLRDGAITVSPVTGFGNGNNTITLGDGFAGAQSVTTGSGNDTININILGGADESMFTLAAGGGNDTLAISGGGSLDMTDFAGVSGFESVSIDGNATTFTANNDALAITAGNGGNAITLGSGTQSVTSGSGADSVALGGGTNIVNTGDGSDTVTGGVAGSDAIDLQGGDDTYTLDASSTGGTVSGGTGGSDTLAIGIGVTATILLGEVANATINGVGYSNFDNLSATGANGALTVTAAAGGSTITTGLAGDNVTAGANADNINTGAGADTVNITSGSYAGDTLDGDAGTDTLAITGGGTVNMNLATISGFDNVSINNSLATTFIADTDNLDISVTGGNAVADITLSATSTQNVTITGTGADTVTLASGSGANGVNTGGGSDTVNGAVEAGDVVDLDADNDTFEYRTIGGDVRGGAGTDTITVLADAGVVSLDLTVGTGNGNYSGFENISAAGANGAITAKAVSTGSTITTGSAGDNVTAGGSADAINTGAGNDSVNITSSTYIGDTLNGGDDTDTLAITGGNTVNMTLANITNFESVTIDGTATTFTANGLDLAISAGGGGNTITLGTGTQNVTITGTGADTVTLGSGNNNVNTGGGADTVIGDVALGDLVNLDAGNDNFDYRAIAITGDVRGGAGTDTITVLADAGAVNLNLNATSGNGVYSGFENISASGANGVITATALATGSTITTGTANDDVTAGGAADSISTGDGDDTVRITSSTYANDTLTGGNNTGAGDTLAITGGGPIDLSVGVTVSGFEKVTIDNSVANVFTAHDAALAITVSGGSVGANITLGDGFAQSVTISGTGNDTVVGGSGVNNINTGDGSDTVTNVGASDVVDLGAGSDTFVYQNLGTASVHGGDGTDTITYTGGGSITIDLSATTGPGNYSGFENVTVTGTGSASIIASDGGSTIATGSGIDELTTGIGIDNFNTGAGDDTINITSLTYSGDTLDGGDDTDTLSITGGESVDISTGVTVTNFEDVLIDNTATTFKANNLNLAITAGDGGNTITLGSGTQSVISGAGADTVTLGGGANNVNTGGGSDTVSGGVGAGDIIDLGAGTDSYAFQTLATGTSVSGGGDNDTLVYSGSDDQVIDFLTTGDNIAAQDGIYSNFENLTATASAGFLNVTAAAVGGTIQTGTGNDTITLGAGVDLVNTGAGADTVFGSVGAGDQINLAGADDNFAYQTLVATATVDGGTSTDTLTYAGSDALIINFTVTNDNIAAEAGTYLNFENLLAASASGNLTVTASTGGSTIVTGSGNDIVAMGAGTDTISTGAGVDVVTGTLSAGEAINLGADNDNYGYQVTTDAANVIDADAGTGDNLTYTGSANLTITFNTVSDNIGAEPGFYRNFENFLAGSATGDYTVIAATTGSVITTGSGVDTITLGAGLDTVNTGGSADNVSGTLTAGDTVNLEGADDTYGYSATVDAANVIDGGTGNDTLTYSGGAETFTFNIITNNIDNETGFYRNFENLSASGATGGLDVTAAVVGSIITTGAFNDIVTLALNNNADTINLGDGSDTISNIGNNDTINLGDGDDTATYTTAVAATIDGGEGNETNGDTLILTTGNAMTLNLSLVDTNQVTFGGVASSWKNFENLSAGSSTHALTVTADSVGSTITTGSGNDNVTAGAGVAGVGTRYDNIATGNGDDTVNITSSTYANDTLDGGGNTPTGDTLAITLGGTVNMTLATISNFENVTIDNSAVTANVFTANDDNLDISVSGGSVGATITLGNGAQDVLIGGTGNDTVNLGGGDNEVNTGDGSDTVTGVVQPNDIVELDAGNDTFAWQDLTVGGSVDGGAGNDTLTIADTDGPVTLDLNDTVGATKYSAFESISAALADDVITVTAAAGVAGTIITGSADDIITLNTGAQIVNAGDGADTVSAIGNLDDVNLADGDDTTTYAAVTAIVDGGANGVLAGEGDTLNIGAGAGALTLNLAAVNAQQIILGGTGTWKNFENISASGADSALTITASSFAPTVITTGLGADSVTLGAADQTVSTNGGDDTIHTTGANLVDADIDGGGQTLRDILDITDASADMTLADSITGIERVTLSFSGTTFIADATIGLDIVGSGGDDSITLGASTQSVSSAGTGNDTIIATDAMVDANLTLDGGGNTGPGDTLRVTDDATLDDGDFTNMLGIENLVLLGTGGQNVGTLGTQAEEAGIVVIDATAALGNTYIDVSGYVTAGVAITTGAGQDFINGGAGNDTLSATGDNDYLLGQAGNDALNGGAGNDYLEGGTGADTLTGGADDDIYAFQTGEVAVGETITETGGTDTLLAWSDTDFSNLAADFGQIERIVINDGGTATFTGAQLAGETIAINEWWWGGGDVTNLVINVNDAGSVTQDFSGLTFGALDTYYDNLWSDGWWWHGEFTDGDDTVTIDATAATVGQSIIGTTIADTINGSAFNDFIEGHDGVDTLQGGAGNDLYIVSDADHRTADEIIDTAGTDDLRFTSTTDAQTLTIYAGDMGLESVTIGTVVGDTSGTTDLNVNAIAGANALIITGNDGDNGISGTDYADTINGNGGDDVIVGRGGADTLSGGAGNDLFIVEAAAEFVAGDAINGGANAGGVDTLRLDEAGTYGNTLLDGGLSDIEVVSLFDDTAPWSLTFTDAAYANADSNGDGTADGTITVSAVNPLTNGVTIVAGTSNNTNELVVIGTNLGGNDDITVGAGTDTIGTGDGDDTVRITSTTYANDTLTGGANTDTLAIDGGGTVNMTLANISGFENVTIDNNDAANVFTANGDDLYIDVTVGGSQAVTINLGGGAQDVDIVGTGGDTVNLGGGENHINTGDGSDSVLGTLSANDTVNLDAGDDTYAYSLTAAGNLIDGGAGNDTLTYSGGVETFDFGTAGDNIAITDPTRYQNFESLAAAGATGALTVTAAAAGSTITTGTGSYGDLVNLGAGTDIVNTGGGSDTVAGGVGITDQVNLGAGDDTFIYEDLSLGGTVDGGADSDTIEVLSGFGPLDFILSSGVNTGLLWYTSFENLDASAAGVGDDINVDAASGGSTITTGDGDDDITAGAGNDVIDAGLGDDIIRITAASYNADDTIDGGGETTDDTLVVTGGGTVDMNTGLIENIEIVEIDNSAVAANVFTANDDDLYIDVSGGDVGATINLGTGAQDVTITGNGNDIVNLGGDTNIVNTGNGSDTVNNVGDGDTVNLEGGNDSTTYDAVTATVDAGEAGGEAGFGDTLTIAATTGAMAIDLSEVGSNQINVGGTGTWQNFESLAAGGASHALTVMASGVGGSITTGSAGDTVALGASGNDTVSTGGGSDTVTGGLAAGDTVDLGAGNDTYTYDSTSTGGSVSGGADEDTLTLGLAGNTAATIFLGDVANTTIGGVAYSNFDNLAALASNEALVVTAADGGSDITTGSAADTIHLNENGVADTVDAGGGSDDVDGIDAGDVVSLGDDADFATFSAVTGAIIGGGTGGTDSDTLIIDDTAVAMSIDLSVVGGQQVAGANSTWQDFENLDAGYAGVTGDLTVTLSTDTNTVTTGAGDDLIQGSLSMGDVIHTGAGDESFDFEEVIGGVTVDAGEGDEDDGGDTLTIASTTGAMTIDLSVVNGQQITVGTTGTWRNFENLDASAADDTLTVTASAGGSIILTGSANDFITLGLGDDYVRAGNGDDTIIVGVGLNSGDDIGLGAGNDNFSYATLATDVVIDGEGDSDTIFYTGAGPLSVDLSNAADVISAEDGTYRNFESFNGFTANGAITVISNAGASVLTGNGMDVVTLSAGAPEAVNTGANADIIHATDLTFNDGDSVIGGSGIDTLSITGGGTFNLTLASVTTIDIIQTDDTGTELILNNMNNLTVNTGTGNDSVTVGASGTQTVNTGDGADSVALVAGTGVNTINTGAGVDEVTGTLSGGDSIDLGGDDDSFEYTATIDSGNIIDGNTGDDELVYSGGSALTINFFTTANNVTGEAGSYRNFEDLDASAAGGVMTVTAAAGGSVIKTGSVGDTINLGAGTDIVNTGDGADIVIGTVSTGADQVDLEAGADNFTYQSLAGGGTVSGGTGSDTLTVGAGSGPLTITLGEIGNTVIGYSNFDNVVASAAGVGDVMTVTAAAGGSSITTGAAADFITLSTTTDSVYAGSGNDTIRATGLTLNGTDTIDGEGGGGDILAITGNDATVMGSGVTGIEIVTLADSVTFTANNTDALVIDGSAFADTINTGDAAGSEQTVNAGAGDDVITLGDNGQVINGENGDDTINVNATTIASTITAGEGGETATGDTLNVTGGSIVTMGSGVTEFERVTLAAPTDFTANNTSGLLIIGSTAIDDITTGNVAQTVNAGTGADLITLGASGQTINGEGGSDTVYVTGTTIDSFIDAGAGDTDVLEVTAGLVVVMDADVVNFETVNLASGLTSFTANDTDNLVINGSALGDTIITGNALTAQTVNAGAGDDDITLGGDGQIINGDDNDDTITVNASTIASTIDGGNGSDELFVVGGGAVSMLSVGANITNFELVTLDEGTVFTANTDATLTIDGSGDADTITVGDAGQVVNAMAGADIIVVTNAQFNLGMTIDGGTDIVTDTLSISDRGASGLVGDGDFSAISNVQTLELAYTGTSSQSVVLGTNAETAGIVTVNASVATGNVTVTDTTGTGALSITTGSGADTITLGTAVSTVVSGTGSDIVNVNGTTIGSDIDAGVGDTDILNVAADGNLVVVMGADVENFETVNLASGLTSFAANDTASLTINGSSGIDDITTGGAVQTVNAGAGDDDITLGAAGQFINGGDDEDTVTVDATTIVSTIAGGEGGSDYDTLYVVGGLTVTMGGTVTQFEEVILDEATIFTANTEDNLLITGSTGADNITTGNAATTQTVNAGTGNDDITLGGDGQTINGEGDDDTVRTTGTLLAGATIDGGANTDTLYITSNSADMNDATSITNFEIVTLSVSGTTFVANDDGTLTINGSGGADTITVGHEDQIVNAGAGADVIIATYAQVSTTLADFNGDGDGDTLRISDAATALADADFTNLDSIETLQLLDATGAAQTVTLDTNAEDSLLATVNASAATAGNAVTVNAANFDNALAITTGAGDDVITLGSGTQSATTNGGDDTVTLGTGANAVSTGAGSDDVTGALSTDDTIDLGADNDMFVFEETVSTSNFVDGGSGTDQIIYSGGARTFDFSNLNLLNNVTGQTGSYRNFENLDATAATGIITATAANSGSTILTATVGTNGDIINLGAGTDIINTYGGNDTVNATGATLDNGASTDDSLDAGADYDTLAITGGGTVNMGTAANFELVTLATATTFTANNTAGLQINGSTGADVIFTGTVAQTVYAGDQNDIITLGAAGQTIYGQNNGDTVVVDEFTIAGGSVIDGGSGSDTLAITGGGSINLVALTNVTSFEEIRTGTTALTNLTLKNTGYQVSVEGGANHVINATTNTGADDTFTFDNNLAQDLWEGAAVTINQFSQGNDILDLGLLGIQTYLEEFGDRTLADAALSGGTRQAVFDSALDILYVDMNADAAINEADDLFIYLSGVTNLTSGTDLVGMII